MPHAAAIDRRAVVQRHQVRLNAADPMSPLSVGNGEFAFTADISGLQTFPQDYARVPLCTLAQWGWHTQPRGAGVDAGALRLREYPSAGRRVGYPTSSNGQEALFRWLRENPHRLHLGRLGLDLSAAPGAPSGSADLESPLQTLDLWAGMLHSRFAVGGRPVEVRTVVHPHRDTLAVRVTSPLLAEGRLGLLLAFPYGSPGTDAADWEQPERHSTELRVLPAGAQWRRRLDGDGYTVTAGWSAGATVEALAPHCYRLRPAPGAGVLEFTATFAPEPAGAAEPPFTAVAAAAARHWEHFWSEGGVVDFAGAGDARAGELERRVVLSQYLTAVHCAGSLPPQETGLLCNSWFGKFHLEMHPWHALHFPHWGRAHLLERSLPWYRRILPAARATAAAQGYPGARWPKMVGPDALESPSTVGPLLCWQQPHFILMAEACFRARPTRETLAAYAEAVQASAEFMAGFASWDEAGGRFVLGPPVIPAQENHPAEQTWNPTFELTYWRYGLELAQLWRERQGLPREALWDHVLAHLAAPTIGDGVYLAHENCPETYSARNRDHPSMLYAYGLLPGQGIDPAVMRATLQRVLAEWQWEHTWGWDYPAVAMTAARLGEAALAVDVLLRETPKNTYLPSGHNWQRDNLPAYLPGNGGLLAAVGMMAAGWGKDADAPGFPAGWHVRWEGLRPWDAPVARGPEGGRR